MFQNLVYPNLSRLKGPPRQKSFSFIIFHVYNSFLLSKSFIVLGYIFTDFVVLLKYPTIPRLAYSKIKFCTFYGAYALKAR